MFKAVNMRIMNWQLFNDKAIRQVTCTMHNGESIVFIFCSHRRRISRGFFCVFCFVFLTDGKKLILV